MYQLNYIRRTVNTFTKFKKIIKLVNNKTMKQKQPIHLQELTKINSTKSKE